MKIHTKKKLYRLLCKKQFRKMLMPDASGNWVPIKGTAGQHCASGATGKLVQC